MSQYIDFVLSRAGAPKPTTIWLVEHKQAWVNHQIQDEFEAIYSNANILINMYNSEINCVDLIVLPYIGTFSSEYLGKKQLFSQVRGSVDLWAMVYGVMYRVIYVMPARKLLSFYWKNVMIDRLSRFANRTRLSRFTSKLSSLFESW